MHSRAPAPPTVSVLSPLSLRRGDRVTFLLGLTARCGEVVRIPRWGGVFMATFTSSAAMAHEILVEQADAFVKGYGLLRPRPW